MDDFNKPKLMYSEIVQEPHFYYDDNAHFYPEATTFIMNGDNLKSLLLILGYISKMVNSRNRINEKIIFLHVSNTEEICDLMHSFLD